MCEFYARFLFSFFLSSQFRENTSIHTAKKKKTHTCGRITAHRDATNKTEKNNNKKTQLCCNVLMLECLHDAKVTKYHSFIPIIPSVGWVRGLLMASTLQKGSRALTLTLETHSLPPCAKSTAHGLFNPSTWLISS